MLTIKCAACKRKLWKYDKVGQGEVLRCHKNRIMRTFEVPKLHGSIECLCGKVVGIDKGSYIKMHKNAFTYRGTKRNA